MSRESVSVVMATFNRANYLPEALDSLLAQTHLPHEIIVVDDGSEDDTEQVVRRYGDRVRYLYQTNAGKAAAVNRALAQCSGRWVWLFDDDDVALPDAIASRLATASAQPEALAVYSPHHLGTNAADGHIVRGRLALPLRPEPEAMFFETMAQCFFHLNSCLVRKEAYGVIGGFDANLLRGQDYDAQIRLTRVARFAFCPSPSFVFRQHDGARGPKALRSQGASRSATFRRFSVDLGLKIRRNVSLGEFSVPRIDGELAGEPRLAALARRAVVMGNHGCISELLSDFEEIAGTCGARALGGPVADLVALAVCRGWAQEAIADDWPGFLRGMRSVRRLPGGGPVTRAVARGLLLTARRYPGSLDGRLRALLRGGRLMLL